MTVTLIIILVSFTTSAVSRAIDTSQASRCMGNLKTLGIAMRSYMEDNNGYAPPHYNAPFHNLDWSKNNWNWMTWLSPYLIHNTEDSQNVMPSVFDCPADSRVKTWPKPRSYLPASPGSGSAPSLGSYGYNYLKLTTSQSWVNSTGALPPRSIAIQNLTQLILIADGRAEEPDTIVVNRHNPNAHPALRHNAKKRFNAVFLDGHIESLPKDAASDSKYWDPK